jgi:hypothetical protein
VATRPQVLVKVGVDARGAKSALDDLTRAFKRSATNINSTFDLIGKGFGVFERGAKSALHVLDKIGLNFTELVKRGAPREVRALQKAFDDLEATMARGFNRSGALHAGLEAVTSLAREFVNIFSGEQGQKLINSFFQAFARGLSDLINAFLGAKKMIRDISASLDPTNASRATRKAMLERQLSNPDLSDGERQQIIDALLGLDRTGSGPAPAQESALDRALAKLADDLGLAGTRGLVGGTALGAKRGERTETTSEQDLRGLGIHSDPFFEAARGRADREFAVDEQLKEQTEKFKEAARDLKDSQIEMSRELSNAMKEAGNEGLRVLKDQTDQAKTMLDGLKDLFKGTFDSPAVADLIAQIGQAISGAFTDMFVGIGEAIGSGQFDQILGHLGGFLGGILKYFGTFAIQMGSLIGTLGLLGLFLPVFAPFTAALPIAGGLVAAGVAAVAVGTAIGGGSAGTGAAPSSSGGGSGRRAFLGRTDEETLRGNERERARARRGVDAGEPVFGLSSGRGGDTIHQTYEINFPPGFVVGSPAEIGRHVRRALAADARLRGLPAPA